MKKIVIVLAIIFCAAGVITAAGLSETESKPADFVIIDSLDREVHFEKTPQTIVSVAPNITEIIFTLGKGEALIGRTDYCDYPAEVNSIDSIGSLQEPNIERIIELNPDVVITSTHFKPDDIETLENIGINVVGFYNDESFEGVYDIISKIGILLDAQDEAGNHIDQMKKDVVFVQNKIAGVETKPSVYYVVGFGQWGDFTPGRDTFIHQLITAAGGNNIAADMEGWTYSFEKIVEADPEIMICSMYWGAKEGLETTDGYKDLNAVKNGALFEIDNNMIDRQGPRLIDGLKALAEIIHPELFGE